jgi:hypothetical protein
MAKVAGRLNGSWEESLKRIEKKIYEVTIKVDKVQGKISDVFLSMEGVTLMTFGEMDCIF